MPKRRKDDPKSSKAKKLCTQPNSDSGTDDSDDSDSSDKDNRVGCLGTKRVLQLRKETGATGTSRLFDSSAAGSVSGGSQLTNIRKQNNINYYMIFPHKQNLSSSIKTQQTAFGDSADGNGDAIRPSTTCKQGQEAGGVVPFTSRASAAPDLDDMLYRSIKTEFISKINPKMILPYLPLTMVDDERVGEVQDTKGRMEAAHFLLKRMAAGYYNWMDFLPEALRHGDLGMGFLADYIEKEKKKIKEAKPLRLKRQTSGNGNSPRSKRQHVAEKDSVPTEESPLTTEELLFVGPVHSQELLELIRFTDQELSDHEDELFCETRSTRIALDTLLRKGSVFLVGRSGDGKTASGYQILREVRKRHKFQPIIVSSPDDVKKLPLDNYFVVFADNIFGISNFSSLLMETWKSLFRKVQYYVKQHSIYFIASSSDRVRDQCQQQLEEIPLLGHVVDTTTPEFSLRDYEKDDILTEYLEKYGLDMSDSDKAKAVHSEIVIGFPQCCKHYVTNETARNYGPQFFQKPFFFLKRQIANIKEQDKTAYLVLLWVIFKKGSLFLKKIHRRSSSLDALKEDLSISSEITKDDIKTAANSLCMMGYLVYDEDEEKYEFSHFTIYSAVCLTLNKIPKILKNCPLSFLLEHTCIDRNKNHMVPIPCTQHLNFIQRLIKEIWSGEFRVLQHSAFCDRNFVRKVFEDTHFTNTLRNALSKEDHIKKLQQLRIIYFMTTSRKYSSFLEELVKLREVQNENSWILHDILEGACSSGDVITLKKILTKNVKPCSSCVEEAAQSHQDNPEIMEKIKWAQIEDRPPDKKLVKMLVSKGKAKTMVNISKHIDWSVLSASDLHQLLMDACASKKFELFTHILNFVGLPENKTNILKTAVIGDSEEIVKYLLMKGASVNSSDIQQRTPLHYACLHNLSHLSALLVEKGAQVDVLDKKGATPFHLACQYGSLEFIKKLLSLGLQVKNTVLSPFHFAAKNRHGSELFETLIKKGAKLDILNPGGFAPIHEAVQCSNYSFVKKIMDDVNLASDQTILTSRDGRTPLHFASVLPHGQRLLELLIGAGADIHMTDNDGRTSLHFAAVECLPKNVEALLKHEANVNAQDQRKQTPLHCAVSSSRDDTDAQLDTIEHLLPETIRAVDMDGNTIVHTAVRNGIAHEVLEKLFQKGECPVILNNSDETPLHLALVPQACLKTVKLLLEKFPKILEKGKCHMQMALEKEAPYTVVKHLLDEGASFDRILWEKISLNHSLKDFSPSDIRDFLLQCEYSFETKRDKNGLVPLLFVCTLRCSHDEWTDIMDTLTLDENISLVDREGSSAVHLVSECPDITERLYYLISKGASKNCKDQKGNTPLHVAARNNNKLGIVTLLEHDASVVELNLKSESVLHVIASVPDLSDCIEKVVRKGADLNAQDCQGNTSLHLAVEANNMRGTHILLDSGANLHLSNHTLEYPLHFVAETKNSELLDLLHKHGADINVKNNRDQTLLHLAVQHDNIQLVKKLMAMGLDVNAKDERGLTPVHYAAMREEHTALLEYLISTGGSVLSKSLRGKTPLHLAAENCFPYQPHEDIHGDEEFESEIIGILTDKSAGNVNEKDSDGFTPVHYAVSCLGILKQLVAAGGSLKQRTKNGQTCLHLAMMNPDGMAVIKYLLEKGLSPADKDSRAYTPLHMAVQFGCNDLNLLRELVQSHREALTDDNGSAVYVLHQAAAYAKEEVIVMLVQELPQLQMFKDMDGKLPIHYAVARGDVSILRLFSQAVKQPGVVLSQKSSRSRNPKSLQRLLSTHERNGRTLLHEASQVGNVQTVDFLLQEGYEVNRKDSNNNMPLHSAAESGSVDKVERLLKNGAVTDVYNDAGVTPLLMASSIGASKVVKVLLNYGGSVSAVAKQDHKSPLHMVCGKYYDRFAATKLKLIMDTDDEELKKTCELLLDVEIGQSCTEILIENGAKLEAKDIMGRNPLHLAAQMDNDVLVKVLLNRGADISAVDRNGKTALHTAVEVRSYNAAWCLVDRGADLRAEDKWHITAADHLLKLPKYWQQKDSRIFRMLQHLS